MDPKEAERLEAARATSKARSQQFLAVLPSALDEWDDRIDTELVKMNASLKAKLGRIYRLVDAVSEVAAPYTACRKGCSGCCKMNVSITSHEAERLADVSGRKMVTVVRPPKHPEDKFAGVPCPFLVNDECSVYEARPFACRAHRSFDLDSYWCQPERAFVAGMGMVRLGGATKAYAAVTAATKLGGFADIRDFFPTFAGRDTRTCGLEIGLGRNAFDSPPSDPKLAPAGRSSRRAPN